MKKMLVLLVLITCIQSSKLSAQDFTFSQFYEQPLLRNPALAGIFSGDIRVSSAHRNQWGSITVPFKTTALSLEDKIPIGNGNDLLTLGMQMTSDMAGERLVLVVSLHGRFGRKPVRSYINASC
jgi:hypothetical protein